jgi:cytochrome c-type biogenesis protein CcmH
MILERFGEAANAFRHLRELVGDEPAVLAQHAGAIAMASGGEITHEAAALLTQALAGDPMDPRGLWLSGIGARQRGDPVQALAYWRTLEPLLGDDARASENLQSMIADAERAAASGTPAVVTTPNPTTAAPGASPPELTVQVSVDQRLADRFSPTDTVFVFARAVTGPPMPLAVARRQAGELPLTVTLNDAMAMAPGMRLSAFDRIRVGARISKTGNALPQPGDLQGETEALATASADKIQIVITDVVP